MNQAVRYLRMIDASKRRTALCTPGSGPLHGDNWLDVRILVYGEEFGRDPRNWQLRLDNTKPGS